MELFAGSIYVYSIWARYAMSRVYRYAMKHVQVVYVGCEEYIGSDEAMYILQLHIGIAYVGVHMQIYLGSIHTYIYIYTYIAGTYCIQACRSYSIQDHTGMQVCIMRRYAFSI